MPFVILALFIGIPLIEIYLFIEVGGWIGLWPTIALVILTAVIGTALLRQQGLATFARAQADLDEQRLPVRELFNGVCLLIGGLLLLTPGFLTDALGFSLLIPPMRAVLGRSIFAAIARSRNIHFSVHDAPENGTDSGFRNHASGGPVIDGEEFGVRRDSDEPADPSRRIGNRDEPDGER